MPIDSRHRAYTAMAERWRRCRDVIAGQDAVHARGEAYLPRLADQDDAEYRAYMRRASFFNATSRTVEALTGMVFRRQPVVELPPALTGFEEDATMAGVPLATFAQKLLYEIVSVGRVAMLVDMPRVDRQPATVAEAEKNGIRPFVALYKTEALINWRYARINNSYRLVLAVLEEMDDSDGDDEFMPKEVTRWRVLRLRNGVYSQEIWERREARAGTAPGSAPEAAFQQIGPAIVPTVGGRPLDRIPLYILGTDGETHEVEEPPLIDLVDVNLSHYRTTADYEHGAHFCGLPTPVVSGLAKESPGDKLYIGSTAAWIFPRPDTRAYYLEFSGAGLGSLATLRGEKEQHMAALGARMLQPEKAAAEAEQTVLARATGELSVLGAMAQGASRALTTMLETVRQWHAASGKASLALSTDYVPAQMTSGDLTAMVSAWQQGAISKRVLFANLKRGEIIDEETTFEDEEAAIGDEPPQLSNQLAALDAQAAAKAKAGGKPDGKKDEV